MGKWSPLIIFTSQNVCNIKHIQTIYFDFVSTFSGLVPRTMRRTLMAATAWTVYEQLMNWLAMKWRKTSVLPSLLPPNRSLISRGVTQGFVAHHSWRRRRSRTGHLLSSWTFRCETLPFCVNNFLDLSPLLCACALQNFCAFESSKIKIRLSTSLEPRF